MSVYEDFNLTKDFDKDYFHGHDRDDDDWDDFFDFD